MTADCISRERREGTLPLLFLTPLKAHDIVYAKGLAHVLRALTFWLAAVPVLTIPFIAGGIGWLEVLMSVLINLCSLCLAATAGLLASARSRVWTRALALALALAFVFLLAFLSILPVLLNFAAPKRTWLYTELPNFFHGYVIALNLRNAWPDFLGVIRQPHQRVAMLLGAGASVILAFLFVLNGVAAWSLNRKWQEQPASARAVWLSNKLFRPVLFQNVLRRWLRWVLQRNPIGWLEQRSWSGRLVVWSWFAIVMCIYSSLFSNLSLYQRGFHDAQGFLATLLAGSIALSAAGSFRRERETGVLELLLVAPLRESQIIWGRVRGIWAQFAPAIALLFAVWLYAASFLTTGPELPTVFLYAVTFVTVPVVGLYFSLTKRNMVAAFLWTLGVQLVIPTAVAMLSRLAAELQNLNVATDRPSVGDWLIPPVCQLLLASVLAWRLHTALRLRRFATATRGS